MGVHEFSFQLISKPITLIETEKLFQAFPSDELIFLNNKILKL